MADTVKVKLSAPISARYAPNSGLPEQDFEVGDVVEVTADAARALIAGGRAAGVEAEQPQQVTEFVEAGGVKGEKPAATAHDAKDAAKGDKK